MDYQLFDKFKFAFVIIMFAMVYAYVAFRLRKKTDLALQDRISAAAMVECGFAIAVSVLALIILLTAGTFGYLIVAVLFPPGIFLIVKKMRRMAV